MLRHLQFKIYHHGCWETLGSEKFPEIATGSLSPFIILKETQKGTLFQGLYKLEGPEQDMNKYVEFVKSRKEMLELNVVDKKPGSKLLFLRPRMTSSTYATLIKNKAIFLDPIKTFAGLEHFNVLVESPNKVVKLLGELDELGEMKVQKIGRYKGAETLFKITDKQKAALETAVAHGYYSHPRKTTVEELAKISGLSRSTFQEHLRKAEAKLIPKYVGEW